MLPSSGLITRASPLKFLGLYLPSLDLAEPRSRWSSARPRHQQGRHDTSSQPESRPSRSVTCQGNDTTQDHNHHHYSDQVPQLKRTRVAWGTAVMNESWLATLILRLLSHMAKIFPSKDGDGAIIR